MAYWVKIMIKLEDSQIQNPLGTWTGLGTQPGYEAHGELWVKTE